MRYAFEDYKEYSGRDHVEFKSFMRWAGLYGVSGLIIDDSSENTRFRYVLSTNNKDEEYGPFDYWPQAIDDMVEKVLEYIEPFAEIRSKGENNRSFLSAHILKSANLMAELVEKMNQGDNEVGGLIDSVIDSLKTSRMFL